LVLCSPESATLVLQIQHKEAGGAAEVMVPEMRLYSPQ
jgi:hypothetical protein